MVYDITTKFDVAPIDKSAEAKPTLDKLRELKQKLYDNVQFSLEYLTGLKPDFDTLREAREKYREDTSKYLRRYAKHLGHAINDYAGRLYSLVKSARKIGGAQLEASYTTRSELEKAGTPIPQELTNAITALETNIPKAKEILSDSNYRPSFWRRIWNRLRGL